VKAEASSKKEKAVEEVTTLGKKIAEGEEYFAVAHIFASFNDTFVVSFAYLVIHDLFYIFIVVNYLPIFLMKFSFDIYRSTLPISLVARHFAELPVE
jgi:hypothetical protein